MTIAHIPEEACLVMGVLYVADDIRVKADKILTEKYGPFLMVSDVIDFNYTTYYNEEMGEGIKRVYYAFETLIKKDSLADIKCMTNTIENDFSSDGKRSINLDPGYLDMSKLILASAKDFSHRIYLRDGIYGEITFIFHKNGSQFLPWSYADYKDTPAQKFFYAVREMYHKQL